MKWFCTSEWFVLTGSREIHCDRSVLGRSSLTNAIPRITLCTELNNCSHIRSVLTAEQVQALICLEGCHCDPKEQKRRQTKPNNRIIQKLLLCKETASRTSPVCVCVCVLVSLNGQCQSSEHWDQVVLHKPLCNPSFTAVLGGLSSLGAREMGPALCDPGRNSL